MRYFETRFMEEANEFIAELDPKIIKKIVYNIDLAEQTNDQNCLRNCKMIFGNFGQNLQDFK